MRSIPNLEIHVSHACNLACESCSHYSNQGHKGLLSLADAEAWMQPWAARIRPTIISLLGGEPTIHPQLAEFLPLARRYWPDAHLRIVTNGFFLHRHPDLPAAMMEAGDAAIYLSIHHQSPEYTSRLRPVIDLLKDWVRNHGIKAHYYESATGWTRRYLGVGSAMEPFKDGQPRQSWQHCPARTCAQLFEGKIWKCAPLAYLGMQNEKYPLSESWAPYLAYQPLTQESDGAALKEFFDREEETACGMCPAQPERFALPLPLRRAMPVRRSSKGPAV